MFHPYHPRMRKLLTLVVVGAALTLTGCSSSPTLTSSIKSIATVDATEVSVTVMVKNTSSSDDKDPVCAVDLYTRGGSKAGGHAGPLQGTVKAGQQSMYVLPIDVKAGTVDNLDAGQSIITCS